MQTKVKKNHSMGFSYEHRFVDKRLKEALKDDEKFIDYMIEGMELFQKLDMSILNRLRKEKAEKNTIQQYVIFAFTL